MIYLPRAHRQYNEQHREASDVDEGDQDGLESEEEHRAAENRTRTTRPPALRTTTIRQPVILFKQLALHYTRPSSYLNSLLYTTRARHLVYTDCSTLHAPAETAYCSISFGPPGIEPGPYEPESYVLPVYYGPLSSALAHFGGARPAEKRDGGTRAS